MFMKRTLLLLTTVTLLTADLPAPARADMISEDVFFAQLPPVVTASKKAESWKSAPGVIEVITAEDIKAFGANSLPEVLDRATSVYMTGSHSFPNNKMGLRGDNNPHIDNHVLYLLNGRPLRENLSGGIQPSLYLAFPVDSIEHLEIVRGPGSVLYGTNAFIGVINIITKKPEEGKKFGGDVSLLGGSFGGKGASLNAGSDAGPVKIQTSVRYFSESGWPADNNMTDRFPAPIPAHIRNTDAITHMGQDDLGATLWAQAGGFTFNGYAARGRQDTLGLLYIRAPAAQATYNRYMGDLGYKLKLPADWELKLNGQYDYMTVFFDDPTAPIVGKVELYHGAYGVLGEVAAQGPLTEKLDLVVGGTAANKKDIRIHTTAFTNDYNKTTFSGYAQSSYAPVKPLKLTAGVQWNKTEKLPTKGRVESAVPLFAVNYNPTEKWGTKLIYGQAFRYAWPAEQLFTSPSLVGNPNLSPERIATTQAQVHYEVGKTRVAVTGFHSDYKELIVRRTVAGVPTYTNAGKLMVNGGELEGRYQATRGLSLTGSYSHQFNKDEAGLLDITAMPRDMLKLGVIYRLKDLATVSLWDSYYGRIADVSSFKPTRSAVNRDSQSFHWVSVHMVLPLSKVMPGLELSLHGENILDEKVYDPEFMRPYLNTLQINRTRAFFSAKVSAKF